ncbi:Uu.00g000290.m01.CDS01 [Anthostomella pinea]|uniref:Uu.00g000290.m01.CDS01 n=1 Tax=Anthostomella pinea TaxID=933095 RepID=A0AAI8VJ49_9PEZI|nr:Uu.00g000290.m01.CDS01 [Anthostomella pinea]
MKKTLLLCFIHGFKVRLPACLHATARASLSYSFHHHELTPVPRNLQGGEDTFGSKSEFAQHLAALIAAALPKVDVRAVTYPKYETRGDLYECAGRFRDWLLEKVIDIEVANGTPSPTVDPSVRVVLIGHSMGGIVAAETVIALTSEHPIKEHESAEDEYPTGEDGVDGVDGVDGEGDDNAETEAGTKAKGEARTTPTTPTPPSPGLNSLMFPYIQGVLAFDTPYLGISPGVVAHGAEGHYNSAATALEQLSGLSGMFWGGDKGDSNIGSINKKPVGALPAAEEKKDGKPNAPPAGGGAWGSWGKIAMYAGAAGAVAAGGAAAYLKREQISSGWSWVGSHLEFVGCLARGEELKNRVRNMLRLNRELDVGFANLYTRLGQGAAAKQVSMVGTVLGSQRTFCNVPSKQAAGYWKEAVNDKAGDEAAAHMGMFEPKENPGYYQLSEDAKNLIVEWSKNEWYETSSSGDIEQAEDLI